MAKSAQPLDPTADPKDMNFTVLVEVFMDIIAVHLRFYLLDLK